MVRFAAALENTSLTTVARGPRKATAARESKTSSSAYSVRSCPSSSRHNRGTNFFIREYCDLRRNHVETHTLSSINAFIISTTHFQLPEETTSSAAEKGVCFHTR